MLDLKLPGLDGKLPTEIIPARSVSIPLAWLIYGVIVLVSISVGYGGYKAGYANEVETVAQAKKEIVQLRSDLNSLTYEMGRLKQAVDDLRESFDRKR